MPNCSNWNVKNGRNSTLNQNAQNYCAPGQNLLCLISIKYFKLLYTCVRNMYLQHVYISTAKTNTKLKRLKSQPCDDGQVIKWQNPSSPLRAWPRLWVCNCKYLPSFWIFHSYMFCYLQYTIVGVCARSNSI